jgi:hypothetical protein
MGNPRRVYIYPPLPEDDGPAVNRFWPPGTAGLPGLPDDQSPPTSQNYPDGYFAQGGGLRGIFSFTGVGGGNDSYRRCMRAAAGDTNQWEEFCRNLPSGRSKTVGGETQNRACWSKTYESKTNKEQWCKNQFGAE